MQAGNAIIALRDSYFNDLVVADNGNIFIFDPFGGSSTATGASQISSTNPVSMCFLDQKVFFASGVSTIGIMSTSTFTCGVLVASTGVVPSTGISLDCTWRGRLVLAGDPQNPQNFYMARLGNPYDWNYAATDAAAAVAGNLSQSGQIGEPITCIIPFNDDLMIMSTVNEVWLIEGDPADGGSIVRLADHGGIVGPYAFTTDNTGTLYYITQAGLWSVNPIWSVYRPPQLISGQSWSYFFESLNINSNAVFLEWDAVNKYLRLYVTPIYTGEAGQHLIYDVRNGGLWPQVYPSTTGPLAVAAFISGSFAGQQLLVLGGWDGNVYYENADRIDDAVSSSTVPLVASATYAPVQFSSGPNFLMERLEVDGGELPSNLGLSTGSGPFYLQVQVVSGPTAANVSDDGYIYPNQDSTSASTYYQTWVSNFQGQDGRQPVSYPRLLGSWFGITVTNGGGQGFFNIERIIAQGSPSGLNRYRR